MTTLDSGAAASFGDAGGLLGTQLPAASDWSPEKRLARAVLESALQTIRAGLKRGRPGRQAREDIEWLMSDDRTCLFSFARVCEMLGLDLGRVRQAVRRNQESPACRAAA